MALAGDKKVVVAIEPQLDRPLKLLRGQAGPDRHVSGLRFLAPETAAHAAALHRHAVAVDAQGMGDPVLHLARVLGARMHQILALLLRQGVGDLTLEVKVLLSTDLQAAAEPVRGTLDPGFRLAAPHRDGGQHLATLGQRLAHCQDGRQRLDVEPNAACSLARLHHAVGHHQCDDLADVLDLVAREDGLVMGVGGQQPIAGNVGGPHQADHARHGQGSAAVQAQKPAMGHARHHRRRIKRALELGHVIYIRGQALHLRPRAFVRV